MGIVHRGARSLVQAVELNIIPRYSSALPFRGAIQCINLSEVDRAMINMNTNPDDATDSMP
jgi:hypothetical protein